MPTPLRYTILLDDAAVQTVERLRATYGLKNKAEVYELATRVLTWLTEQRVAGYEVGRFKSETFQPLLLPYEPKVNQWRSFEDDAVQAG